MGWAWVCGKEAERLIGCCGARRSLAPLRAGRPCPLLLLREPMGFRAVSLEPGGLCLRHSVPGCFTRVFPFGRSSFPSSSSLKVNGLGVGVREGGRTVDRMLRCAAESCAFTGGTPVPPSPVARADGISGCLTGAGRSVFAPLCAGVFHQVLSFRSFKISF